MKKVNAKEAIGLVALAAVLGLNLRYAYGGYGYNKENVVGAVQATTKATTKTPMEEDEDWFSDPTGKLKSAWSTISSTINTAYSEYKKNDNPCCEVLCVFKGGFYCDQRKETRQVYCNEQQSNGSTVSGNASVSAERGGVSGTVSGGASGTQTASGTASGSRDGQSGTGKWSQVKCPTDGNCNNCTEYNPCGK